VSDEPRVQAVVDRLHSLVIELTSVGILIAAALRRPDSFWASGWTLNVLSGAQPPRLRPKTAFPRFPPFHRVDPAGQLRVDSGCLTAESAAKA
jgi:hypothetical protein